MEDPVKMLETLLGSPNREPGVASQFYLPKSLNAEFRKICGRRNASKILAVLIRNFLEGYRQVYGNTKKSK